MAFKLKKFLHSVKNICRNLFPCSDLERNSAASNLPIIQNTEKVSVDSRTTKNNQDKAFELSPDPALGLLPKPAVELLSNPVVELFSNPVVELSSDLVVLSQANSMSDPIVATQTNSMSENSDHSSNTGAHANEMVDGDSWIGAKTFQSLILQESLDITYPQDSSLNVKVSYTPYNIPNWRSTSVLTR